MTKKNLFLLFFFITLMSSLILNAQVSIGTLEAPVSGSLLQLKTIGDEISNGDANTTKGFGLPRVELVKKDQLQPMYPADEAASLTEAIKNAHKGLVVYNVKEVVEENLNIGLNYWDGEEWNSFQQKSTTAQFEVINCSAYQVNGEYFHNISLNTSHYLTVSVNVIKPGYYAINVVPDPANGYYFSTSGEFMTTGMVEIIVPGAGKPVNFTPDGDAGDKLTASLNGEICRCNSYVKIEDSSYKPFFAMSCNSVVVSGVYQKDVAVTPNEKITMRVNVYNGAQGATWRASTDQINGLWFEGSGVLGAAGSQEIILYAKGTPVNTSTKRFTITTNSQSTTATCNATVTPVIKAKRIIAAGDLTYGLTSGGTSGCGAMIDDKMNYGPYENSIVKYEGFEDIQTSLNLINLSSWVSGSNPYDIIVITYNLTPNEAQRALLVDYVNRGGVLIYLDQNVTANNTGMVSAIFGEDMSNPVDITTTCNQVIKMNPGINDEISNGPFGDVRDSQWGEDFANSCGLSTIPYGAIVYAGATNASTGLVSTSGARATILRHPTKNFFWCGDSGLIHGGTSTNYTSTPFWVGSRIINGVTYPKYPVDKPYGSQLNRLPVCNSTLFANVMAWAIKMAEENGINSGK